MDQDEIAKYLAAIYAQREEILKAVVAKYGFEPDNIQQITQTTPNGSLRRYVTYLKKEEPT